MDDPDPANWRTAADPASGKTYWYHRKTRQSTWVMPACLHIHTSGNTNTNSNTNSNMNNNSNSNNTNTSNNSNSNTNTNNNTNHYNNNNYNNAGATGAANHHVASKGTVATSNQHHNQQQQQQHQLLQVQQQRERERESYVERRPVTAMSPVSPEYFASTPTTVTPTTPTFSGSGSGLDGPGSSLVQEYTTYKNVSQSITATYNDNDDEGGDNYDDYQPLVGAPLAFRLVQQLPGENNESLELLLHRLLTDCLIPGKLKETLAAAPTIVDALLKAVVVASSSTRYLVLKCLWIVSLAPDSYRAATLFAQNQSWVSFVPYILQAAVKPTAAVTGSTWDFESGLYGAALVCSLCLSRRSRQVIPTDALKVLEGWLSQLCDNFLAPNSKSGVYINATVFSRLGIPGLLPIEGGNSNNSSANAMVSPGFLALAAPDSLWLLAEAGANRGQTLSGLLLLTILNGALYASLYNLSPSRSHPQCTHQLSPTTLLIPLLRNGGLNALQRLCCGGQGTVSDSVRDRAKKTMTAVMASSAFARERVLDNLMDLAADYGLLSHPLDMPDVKQQCVWANYGVEEESSPEEGDTEEEALDADYRNLNERGQPLEHPLQRDVEWSPRSGTPWRLCSAAMWARCPSLRGIITEFWDAGGGGLELTIDTAPSILHLICTYLQSGVLLPLCAHSSQPSSSSSSSPSSYLGNSNNNNAAASQCNRPNLLEITKIANELGIVGLEKAAIAQLAASMDDSTIEAYLNQLQATLSPQTHGNSNNETIGNPKRRPFVSEDEDAYVWSVPSVSNGRAGDPLRDAIAASLVDVSAALQMPVKTTSFVPSGDTVVAPVKTGAQVNSHQTSQQPRHPIATSTDTGKRPSSSSAAVKGSGYGQTHSHSQSHSHGTGSGTANGSGGNGKVKSGGIYGLLLENMGDDDSSNTGSGGYSNGPLRYSVDLSAQGNPRGSNTGKMPGKVQPNGKSGSKAPAGSRASAHAPNPTGKQQQQANNNKPTVAKGLPAGKTKPANGTATSREGDSLPHQNRYSQKGRANSAVGDSDDDIVQHDDADDFDPQNFSRDSDEYYYAFGGQQRPREQRDQEEVDVDLNDSNSYLHYETITAGKPQQNKKKTAGLVEFDKQMSLEPPREVNERDRRLMEISRPRKGPTGQATIDNNNHKFGNDGNEYDSDEEYGDSAIASKPTASKPSISGKPPIGNNKNNSHSSRPHTTDGTTNDLFRLPDSSESPRPTSSAAPGTAVDAAVRGSLMLLKTKTRGLRRLGATSVSDASSESLATLPMQSQPQQPSYGHSNSNSISNNENGNNRSSSSSVHNVNEYYDDVDNYDNDANDGYNYRNRPSFNNSNGNSSSISNGNSSLSQQPSSQSTGGQQCQCPDCGRMFNPEPFAKHVKICAKVFVQKRKVFDSASKRIADPEQATAAPIAPKRGTSANYANNSSNSNIVNRNNSNSNNNNSSHSNLKSGSNNTTSNGDNANNANSKQSKWRQQSEMFREVMKNARATTVAMATGAPLPPPVMSAPDPSLIPCPHCSRRFNEKAAERHIPVCQNIRAKPTALRKGSGTGAAGSSNNGNTTGRR